MGSTVVLALGFNVDSGTLYLDPVAAGYAGFGLPPSNGPPLHTTAKLVIYWKIFQYKMKSVVDIIPDSDSHVTVPLGLNPGVFTAAVDCCSCLGRGMELNLYFVQTAELHSAQSHHLHNVHCI